MSTRSTVTTVPLMMLELVPKGYYAVRPDTITPYVFMRLSRPTTGKRKGWVKVQTQHGGQLYDRWLWNPGNLDPHTNVINLTWNKSTFPANQSIEDLILLLIVNVRESARAYAAEIGNCHRCNTELTDERSRWYGFGPECEKHLTGEKDEIDDERNGTYEMHVMADSDLYQAWTEKQKAVVRR